MPVVDNLLLVIRGGEVARTRLVDKAAMVLPTFFRCDYASLQEVVSVRPSVGPSVRPMLFPNDEEHCL